jgi:hypothetical protein
MSVSDSHLFNRTYDTKNFYPLTVFSLNEIFKESMSKVQSELSQANIIVRCENLPQITGNRQEISEAFETLIRMILRRPSGDAKLYLFLDCAETSGAGTSDAGSKSYTIKFRTNILPGENWEDLHRHSLDRCRKILLVHQAVFLVNSNNANGCLFSISLPGKF